MRRTRWERGSVCAKTFFVATPCGLIRLPPVPSTSTAAISFPLARSNTSSGELYCNVHASAESTDFVAILRAWYFRLIENDQMIAADFDAVKMKGLGLKP